MNWFNLKDLRKKFWGIIYDKTGFLDSIPLLRQIDKIVTIQALKSGVFEEQPKCPRCATLMSICSIGKDLYWACQLCGKVL